MAKKLAAVSVAFVLMFGCAMPADALQVSESSVLRTESAQSVIEVDYDGQEFYQGTGVTWVYDVNDLGDYHYYDSDYSISVTDASGTGAVRCNQVAGSTGSYSITATRAGTVTVTCTITWTEELSEWDDAEDDYTYTPVQQTETHAFVIKVVDLKNTSGTRVGCVASSSSYISKLFTFKLSGLPANATIEKVSDSNKKGSSYIEKVERGKVTLRVSGAGTHVIKLRAYGKVITCKAILRAVSLKMTDDVKNTGSLVAYPGMKSTVALTATGVKTPKATWVSTNKGVATVTKKGAVRAKQVGRCYLKAKYGGAIVRMLVEVTPKGAYQAVLNGFEDMGKKLTYSQPNRMASDCRDCSSFVSRCYWDPSLGRRIALIGGSGASSWAYNAAMQAQWLNDSGRRVSWSACSTKKLRPGDTVYFETDYAGKDASQWHYIDHAALYVGNGRILQTGGYGGKGTVGISSYWPKSPGVKFVGRPLG